MREEQWGITVFTEQRVQVNATRFRVPDLTVVAGTVSEATRILTDPLVLNPRTRHGYIYTSEGMREAKDGILRVAGTRLPCRLRNSDE
jgi:hypothetical protein